MHLKPPQQDAQHPLSILCCLLRVQYRTFQFPSNMLLESAERHSWGVFCLNGPRTVFRFFFFSLHCVLTTHPPGKQKSKQRSVIRYVFGHNFDPAFNKGPPFCEDVTFRGCDDGLTRRIRIFFSSRLETITAYLLLNNSVRPSLRDRFLMLS